MTYVFWKYNWQIKDSAIVCPYREEFEGKDICIHNAVEDTTLCTKENCPIRIIQVEGHDSKKVDSSGRVNVGRSQIGKHVEIWIEDMQIITTSCPSGRFFVENERVSIGRTYAGKQAEIYYLKDS